MKCEECLPLLEEYFDSELETGISGGVAAHLFACAECASAHAELQVDQETYSHYRREMAATSAPWESFRARMEETKGTVSSATFSAPPARPAPAPRFFLATVGIIRALFSSRYALAPALALAVAIMLGLLIHLDRNANHPQPASQLSNVETAAAKQTDKTSSVPVGSPGAFAHESSEKRDETQVVLAGDRSTNSRTVSQVKSKRTNDIESRTRPLSLELRSDVGKFSEPSSLGATMVLAAHANDDVSKHVEGAQALLRAFRNETPTGKVEALDLSYEKQLARNILDRNILLRRDAEKRRNLPVADLLGNLEPVLLDIANIEERASPDEVRAIVELMEKKGIVAKLQVRAGRPNGPNFRIGSVDQN
jgi:hypothetical protein